MSCHACSAKIDTGKLIQEKTPCPEVGKEDKIQI
jgi:hypothetical protein